MAAAVAFVTAVVAWCRSSADDGARPERIMDWNWREKGRSMGLKRRGTALASSVAAASIASPKPTRVDLESGRRPAVPGGDALRAGARPPAPGECCGRGDDTGKTLAVAKSVAASCSRRTRLSTSLASASCRQPRPWLLSLPMVRDLFPHARRVWW